jgi:hypothetical protein
MFCTCNLTPTLVPKFPTMWRMGCMKGRQFLKFPAKWKVISETCVSVWKTISKKGPWPMWNSYMETFVALPSFSDSFVETFVALSSFSDSFVETFVALSSFYDSLLRLWKFWEFWEFLRFIPRLTVLLLHPCVLANKYSCRQDHQDLKIEGRSSCSNLIVVFKFTSDESVSLVSASLAFGECWQIHVARVSAGGGICVFREIFCLFFSFCKRAAEDYNRSKEENVTSLVNSWRWLELSPACCTLHLTCLLESTFP